MYDLLGLRAVVLPREDLPASEAEAAAVQACYRLQVGGVAVQEEQGCVCEAVLLNCWCRWTGWVWRGGGWEWTYDLLGQCAMVLPREHLPASNAEEIQADYRLQV
jgi:hypothetical protein